MEQVETDIVLSAIRRGEDSLPKLRAATGLGYEKLHPVLYSLEFDYRSIKRSETADGFDRYTLANESNGGFKGVQWSGETPIPPRAFVQSKLSLAAREISIIQRDAPYCVGCHNLCLVSPAGNRIEWRCRVCDVTFEGSSEQTMGYVQPESEPGISVMRPREPLGPEEEEAIEEMRIAEDELPDEPRERAVIELVEGDVAQDDAAPPRNFEIFDKRGRPRIEIDLKLLEDSLADTSLTVEAACKKTGVNYNTVHSRKRTDAELAAAWDRGMARRAGSNGHSPKPGENITETITAVAENPVSPETMKTAIEFRRDALCMRLCDPATVGHHKDCLFWPANRKPVPMPSYAQPYVVEGFLRLNITMNVSIAEMQLWNPYDISKFFDALATLQKLGNPNGSLR